MATAAGRTTRAPRQTTEPRTKVRWRIVALAATGGSYTIALVLSGGLSIVGAISYLFVVGRIEPLPTAGA
jgi:hypothetical protein